MKRSWTEIAIGAWLIASPWLLGFSSIQLMKWGNLAAGAAIILLNIWAIYGKSDGSAK